MPYDPKAVTEEERSNAYRAIWIGVIGAPIHLANAFLGYDFLLFALAWGATMTGLVLASFSYTTDEYMRGRLETSMRFAIGALTLYLFAAWILNVADIAHSAGYALATSEAASTEAESAAFLTDAQTLASIIAAAFYVGYVYEWAKDRFGG
ncbi:MAG: hypothetical protein QNJ15_03975 [Erythrobacter sp.]|nr:hypothetical protein [Erythrobacter sp.]